MIIFFNFSKIKPENSIQRIFAIFKKNFFTGIFSFHRALIWLQSSFSPNIYEEHFSYFHLLKINDLPKRQLYLYSIADDICNYESIELFQTKEETDYQCQIQKKCWQDSLHVEHFRKYPNEYEQLCISFVDSLI